MSTFHKLSFLQHQIDLIAVPVFVTDQCDDDQFRFAAINSEYARILGLAKDQVSGRTHLDVLSDHQRACEAERRYRLCIGCDEPICYRDRVVSGETTVFLDTTLQKVALGSRGLYRIVGTAIQIDERLAATNDIEFFLSLARNSLTTIEMLMSAGRERQHLSVSERDATEILCRKALLSLDDIQRSASRFTRSAQPGTLGVSEAVRNLLLQ